MKANAVHLCDSNTDAHAPGEAFFHFVNPTTAPVRVEDGIQLGRIRMQFSSPTGTTISWEACKIANAYNKYDSGFRVIVTFKGILETTIQI